MNGWKFRHLYFEHTGAADRLAGTNPKCSGERNTSEWVQLRRRFQLDEPTLLALRADGELLANPDHNFIHDDHRFNSVDDRRRDVPTLLVGNERWICDPLCEPCGDGWARSTGDV